MAQWHGLAQDATQCPRHPTQIRKVWKTSFTKGWYPLEMWRIRRLDHRDEEEGLGRGRGRKHKEHPVQRPEGKSRAGDSVQLSPRQEERRAEWEGYRYMGDRSWHTLDPPARPKHWDSFLGTGKGQCIALNLGMPMKDLHLRRTEPT